MSGPLIVTFNYSQWQFDYPTLAQIPEGQATLYFNMATIYCDNSPLSPIRNIVVRALILGLLTAHIATLMGPGASGLVGRVTNASEGSVAVAVDMPSSPGAAWFNQTTYGAAAYMAMLPYRSGGRYRPGIVNYPAIPGFPYGFRRGF